MSFVPKHIPHGQRYTFVYYGCRCSECTRANREYTNEARAKRYAQPKSPSDPRHGTRGFYVNHGCRCDRCTYANSVECKAYDQSRKPQAVAA